MQGFPRLAALIGGLAFAAAAAGCGHDDHDHDHENEVITTVSLTFTPTGGGAAVTALWNDPDGEGGNPPMIGPVNLAAGMYDLALKFENRLETPPTDITKEIRDEGGDHQIFFTGTAVAGPSSNQMGAPLTHSYADMDSKGLPIGLANKITAAKGTGMLTIVLRHLPAVNNMPVKVAGLAENVRDKGLASIGGSSDAEVTFPVTVP